MLLTSLIERDPHTLPCGVPQGSNLGPNERAWVQMIFVLHTENRMLQFDVYSLVMHGKLTMGYFYILYIPFTLYITFLLKVFNLIYFQSNFNHALREILFKERCRIYHQANRGTYQLKVDSNLGSYQLKWIQI